VIRSDMRALLRGWLQEEVADLWDDTEANRFLNLGIQEAQKTLLAVDPEAVKATYTAHIVVPATGKDAIYTYPAGTWAVIEIATSTDGINYDALKRISLGLARQGYTGFVPYDARSFVLAPSPSTAVTNGLRAMVVPTLVMAADTDECPLPAAFHILAIRQAEKLALKKAGEPTDKVQAEIDKDVQDVPRFYLTATEPSFLVPTVMRY